LLCAKCQMYLQTATSTEWTHPSDIMVFLLIRSYAVYSNLNVCELLLKNLHCIHKEKNQFVASFPNNWVNTPVAEGLIAKMSFECCHT